MNSTRHTCWSKVFPNETAKILLIQSHPLCHSQTKSTKTQLPKFIKIPTPPPRKKGTNYHCNQLPTPPKKNTNQRKSKAFSHQKINEKRPSQVQKPFLLVKKWSSNTPSAKIPPQKNAPPKRSTKLSQTKMRLQTWSWLQIAPYYQGISSVNLTPFRNRTKLVFFKYLQQLEKMWKNNKHIPFNHILLPTFPLQFHHSSSSSSSKCFLKKIKLPHPLNRPNRQTSPPTVRRLPSQVSDERFSRLQRHRCHDHQSGPWPKAWTNLGGFGWCPMVSDVGDLS